MSTSDAASADLTDAGINQTDAAVETEDAALQVTVLRDAVLDGGARYQLLELRSGERGPSYAQWFPPPDGGSRPVVVITRPYDGIDWTGQEVDQRWAELGPGLWPDVDGRATRTRSAISYTPLSPERLEEHFVYGTIHNFGTLHLYGRFYAGGDVQNDIDDMTLGLDFLAQAGDVDRARIGIFGGSWGGFEALYGAAYARGEVKPKVGVALSPLVDFEQEVDFVTRELPARYQLPASRTAYATFFEPYLRRVEATRAARGGYQALRAADLVARIHNSFLWVHHDWDTLTPFAGSERLVSLAPSVFKPLYFLHAAPPARWDDVVPRWSSLPSGCAS